MFQDEIRSALDNLIVLVLVPFGIYFLWRKLRTRLAAREIFERAGLRVGEARYVGYSAIAAVVAVGALLLWQPPIDVFTREGSAQRHFVGVGFGAALPAALVYGVVKTGFCEELLFRGLIAGALSRRLSLAWANLWQAVIFLLPHLAILVIMPEVWGILPIVFVFALFKGWVRIRSGSILGPWLLHAAANVTMCLYIAA